jgi:hypothetical protein
LRVGGIGESEGECEVAREVVDAGGGGHESRITA